MSLVDTLGAVQVGNCLSMLSCGVVLCKAVEYYTRFPQDRLVFKLSVAFATLLTVLDTAFVGVWTFDWTVTSYGNPMVMANVPWALVFEIGAVGFATLNTQTFFAWRLWRISDSKNYILPGIILTLAVMQWCVILWVVSFLARNGSFAQLSNVFPTGYVWLVGSIVGDALITIGMCYYLLWKTRDNSQDARGMFRRIVRKTIQSNALSLITQIMDLLLYKLNLGMWFLCSDMCLVKAYAFSLIVSLTSRHSSVQQGTSGTDSDFGPSRGMTKRKGGIGGLSGRSQQASGVQIGVNVSVQEEHDDFGGRGGWSRADHEAGRPPVAVNFADTSRDLEAKRRPEEHELDSL